MPALPFGRGFSGSAGALILIPKSPHAPNSVCLSGPNLIVYGERLALGSSFAGPGYNLGHHAFIDGQHCELVFEVPARNLVQYKLAKAGEREYSWRVRVPPGSSAHTYVNNSRVMPGNSNPAYIMPGDTLRLGPMEQPAGVSGPWFLEYVFHNEPLLPYMQNPPLNMSTFLSPDERRLVFQAAVQGLAQGGGAEGVDVDQGGNQAGGQAPEGGNTAMDDDSGVQYDSTAAVQAAAQAARAAGASIFTGTGPPVQFGMSKEETLWVFKQRQDMAIAAAPHIADQLRKAALALAAGGQRQYGLWFFSHSKMVQQRIQALEVAQQACLEAAAAAPPSHAAGDLGSSSSKTQRAALPPLETAASIVANKARATAAKELNARVRSSVKLLEWILEAVPVPEPAPSAAAGVPAAAPENIAAAGAAPPAAAAAVCQQQA